MDAKLECEVDVDGTLDMIVRGERKGRAWKGIDKYTAKLYSPRSVRDTRLTRGKAVGTPTVLVLGGSASQRLRSMKSTVIYPTVSCRAICSRGHPTSALFRPKPKVELNFRIFSQDAPANELYL